MALRSRIRPSTETIRSERAKALKLVVEHLDTDGIIEPPRISEKDSDGSFFRQEIAKALPMVAMEQELFWRGKLKALVGEHLGGLAEITDVPGEFQFDDQTYIKFFPKTSEWKLGVVGPKGKVRWTVVDGVAAIADVIGIKC